MSCNQREALFNILNEAVKAHASTAGHLSNLAGICDRSHFTEAFFSSRHAMKAAAEARRVYEEHAADHGC